MPANTAKPIGKTDNDVPGNLNAAESAAEVPEGEVDDDDDEACPNELGLAPAPLAGLTVDRSVVEAAETTEDVDVAEAGKLVDEEGAADEEGATEDEALDVTPVEDVCEHA